jgi:hypothetical protein
MSRHYTQREATPQNVFLTFGFDSFVAEDKNSDDQNRTHGDRTRSDVGHKMS